VIVSNKLLRNYARFWPRTRPQNFKTFGLSFRASPSVLFVAPYGFNLCALTVIIASFPVETHWCTRERCFRIMRFVVGRSFRLHSVPIPFFKFVSDLCCQIC